MLRRNILRSCAPAAPQAVAEVARGADRAPLLFKQGESYSGYQLLSQRRFPELNLTSYEFVHTKTRARYFHFDTPDTNNTFCIGFGTPAQNSKGTTHVLEHTALCGSNKFPVRDPFFHMLRRSLSTFMNAMTGADYTMYPFATTNVQDFANLLDVYIDAVFCPLLRAEDFRQEGHRLEAKEDDPTKIGINGVVYNEMRGVVSEPSSVFTHELMKSMLPGTHYEHVSGGYPPAILDLTHEELVAFHRTHYHPSNSITITYGDLAPHAHMQALGAAFAKFDPSAVIPIPTLGDAQRRTEETVVHAVGPLNAMGDVKEQNRVALSFACPKEQSTLDDMVRLVVLDALLSSGPSSPLYQSLLESKLGSRYCPMSGFGYYLSSPIITYGVEGVSSGLANKEEVIRNAILNTMEEVKAKGFDQRRVASVVFQEELQQKHRSANYGIGLCTTLCALGLVRPNLSPCDFINWLPQLKRIETSNASDLLPLLDSTFLGNKHRTVLSVEPNESCLKGLQQKLDDKEAYWNKTLTEAQKAKIATDTEEWRTRVRRQEDTSCLPTLKVCDIPRAAFQEPTPQRLDHERRIFTIPHPTNGLVYVHGVAPFPRAVLDALCNAKTASVDPFVPLYVGLIGATGAGGMDFKELSIATELVCAGFGFSPLFVNRATGRDSFTAGVSYNFYTTNEKLKEALELLRVILAEPRVALSDDLVRSRVQTLATAQCSRAIQSITRSGNVFAQLSATSNLTACAAVKEAWGGLVNCNASSKLLDTLKNNETSTEGLDRVLQAYGTTTSEFARSIGAGTVWATCEPDAQAMVGQQLAAFVASFPTNTEAPPCEVSVPAPSWSASARAPPVVTEHRMPIDTSFVGAAIPNNLTTLDRAQQAIRIGAQLLKNEYLHRVVREEGGAYGAAASSNLAGEVGGITMSSYRDPTPKKTVTAFSNAASVLSDPTHVTQQRVDEAKLRLFAAIDAPVSADTYGRALFVHGTDNHLRQQVREMLLEVSVQDVVDSAQYFDMERSARIAILQPLQGGDSAPAAAGGDDGVGN